MATTPQPRSYADCLADIVDPFLSKTGLRGLKVGSGILSMMESAAQSDLRCTEDTFTLLDADGLDNSEGAALLRIGADEEVPKQTETAAQGFCDVVDASFTKVASRVFQGHAAPIAGTLVLYVSDASEFTAPGELYVGRGTGNLEGPLAFTAAPVDAGAYWTITLDSATTRFHNQGEQVTLAQGGLRTVQAGTVVQTQQGNSLTAAQFRTLYPAYLLDGETQALNVPVVALKPGASGNVPNGTVTSFLNGPPFTGATVSNPSAISNGLPAESDTSYRERIRSARRSRSRGTPLAIQTGAVGVTAPDESKRVLTAALVDRGPTTPATLYIDDGQGYEERATGVAVEGFVDDAVGGEDRYRVAHRPVAKAYLVSTLQAPFTLQSGAQLAFTVGGRTTVHTLSSDRFRAIGSADPQELVDSVGADASLDWVLRTYDQGTRVAAMAKADTNESIQYAPGSTVVDANEWLEFPVNRVDTLKLYRNDVLLNKDGSRALLSSTRFSLWPALGPTEDLELQVDGAPLTALVGGTYTFTAADFVAAGTGYSAVARNTPEAWGKVIEYRIPGVAASVVNGFLVLSSNRGLSSRAGLAITGGSLVSKGVFAVQSATGADSDYELDRNTGALVLGTPLAAGDKLAAGTSATRAFTATPAVPATTLASQGNLWFTVDAAAALVAHAVTPVTTLTYTNTAKAWGRRQRVAATAAFANVQEGDWAIFWDPGAPAPLTLEAFRVAAVQAAGDWIEIDTPTAIGVGSGTLPAGGLAFVRTTAQLELAAIPAAVNYTAATLAAAILPYLPGATPAVYRTTTLRVRTNTFALGGDVALVAADAVGQQTLLPVSGAVQNLVGHVASVESGNSDLGTPDFHEVAVTSATGAGDPTIQWSASTLASAFEDTPDVSRQVVGLRPPQDGPADTDTRYGTNNGYQAIIKSWTTAPFDSYVLDLRTNPTDWFLNDRVYMANPYRFTPDDVLAVLVDGDSATQRYGIPMARTCSTSGAYGATLTLKDADNSNLSLAVAFGTSGDPFDFDDFAVWMSSRVATHQQGDAVHYWSPPANTAQTILWRYYRRGPDGDNVRLQYTLPLLPSSTLEVLVDDTTNNSVDLSVQLGSGTLVTGYHVDATQKVGVAYTSTDGTSTLAVVLLGFKATNANGDGAGNTVLTLDIAGVGVTNHNIAVGQTVYVNTGSGLFPSGAFAITAAAAGTITYNDGGTHLGAVGISGTMTYGPAESTFTGASPAVAAGQYLNFTSATGLPSLFHPTAMVQGVANNSALSANILGNPGVSTVVAWYTLGDVAGMRIFANLGQTATAVAAAVNALTPKVLTGKVIGTGLGIIYDASYSEAITSGGTAWFQMADGLNYCQTTTAPGTTAGQYTFLLKSPVTATLVSNSDWANEVVELVPCTAKNTRDWLSALGVSGLGNVCEVARSSRGRKVQIASLRPGSEGSVEVQGGTANAVQASVLGAAFTTGGQTMGVKVRTQDLPGLAAHQWVSVDCATPLPKGLVFDSSTILNSITAINATDFRFAFGGGGSPIYTSLMSSANAIVAIERQGNFWALRDTGLGTSVAFTGVSEGDWIRIAAPAAVVYVGAGGDEAVETLNTANAGQFRVVRVIIDPDHFGNGGTVWIENASGVEQALAEAHVECYTADSLMPGDFVRISTSLWDGAASNQGVFEVIDVGNAGAGSFLNDHRCTLQGALSAVSVAAPALGTSYPLVQAVEGQAARYIKEVMGVVPDMSDATLSDLMFTTGAGAGRIGAAAGSVVSVLDKLAFPTDPVQGVDGYRYSTGLLGEVNRVEYGDPSDTQTYPGVVAAGAHVNLEGSRVKRIQVTLSIRTRTGTLSDVRTKVKAAVAAYVNALPAGVSVSISGIEAAVQRVAGVVSVVVVSPAPSVGADLIAVQPYQKPRVLNVDQDVLVSFIGE